MTSVRRWPGRCIFAFLAILSVVGSEPARAKTIKVTMQDLNFSPREFKAKVGDTVIWINKDIFPHTASVEGGFDVFVDGKMSERLTLDKAGDFEFYCRFHPNMRGMIKIAPKAMKK